MDVLHIIEWNDGKFRILGPSDDMVLWDELTYEYHVGSCLWITIPKDEIVQAVFEGWVDARDGFFDEDTWKSDFDEAVFSDENLKEDKMFGYKVILSDWLKYKENSYFFEKNKGYLGDRLEELRRKHEEYIKLRGVTL